MQLNDVGKRREYPYKYSYLISCKWLGSFFPLYIFSHSDRTHQNLLLLFCFKFFIWNLLSAAYRSSKSDAYETCSSFLVDTECWGWWHVYCGNPDLFNSLVISAGVYFKTPSLNQPSSSWYSDNKVISTASRETRWSTELSLFSWKQKNSRAKTRAGNLGEHACIFISLSLKDVVCLMHLSVC